jgi:hypothetical protein
MKLFIVADSDRRGMSGVGDYALLLADALRSSGLTVIFHAFDIHDHLAKASLLEAVKEAKPDWVSFHFVPYAYAHRGLVGPRTLPWAQLRGGIGTHILFHEIWIGAHQGALWRHRFVGLIQRWGISQALRLLKPDVVHCTNFLYSALLEKAAISNQLLPLFSNIPACLKGHDPYAELLGRLSSGSSRSDWTVAGFFGSIYPSVNLLPCIQWLQAKGLSQSKRLLIVSFGNSPMAKATFSALDQHFFGTDRPLFHVEGRLDAATISLWIRNADCGIATTPFNIIQKSGSAVSFVEHGVPVITTDPGDPVRGIGQLQPDLAPEIWLLGDPRLEVMQSLPERRPPQCRLDHVLNQFLADLKINGI